ncbi:hypothetical protein SNOG_10943 [Parastagonospora nodorum SN15]|uniref:Uncharacterized protein n=1 Tax=Phaeosphaeria nodorum (strain SN15 / ATCC MYA-4574 / FGSC 10173) TaxID=321614 RepID=Q0UBC1_PHANO|nr:hypothetical protein SNOG_10943 [Parastagonospora nodorum SN15]EAT81442.1 hypothetical protein SNOG_10943 [Parastagonospora nodorum SN15]
MVSYIREHASLTPRYGRNYQVPRLAFPETKPASASASTTSQPVDPSSIFASTVNQHSPRASVQVQRGGEIIRPRTNTYPTSGYLLCLGSASISRPT